MVRALPARDAPVHAVAMQSEPPRESGPSPSPSAPPSIPPSDQPPPDDGSLTWRVAGVIRTLRPHQWVKNVFVLAPVVFAREVFEPKVLARAASAFVIFCLLASAVYTINDVADVEADKLHRVKRNRPIAFGRVPISLARGLATVLVITSLGSAALVSTAFLVVAAIYLAQNLAYSFRLKHVAYVDVGCISAGFVLRVMAGGYATGIQVSTYLLLCTALLALFLGFGKRRHELATAEAGRAGRQRVALESYTKRGLDLALGVTALATVATYVAYCLDPRTRALFKNDYLWVSCIFVLLGVRRFLYLVRHRPKSESPTQEMLRDGPFVAIVLLWVVLVMWVVYKLRPS